MPLTDGLISYWKLDEASGNDALDAHGANVLTDTFGNVGTAAGKIGTARDFQGTPTLNWFRTDDNASLSVGNVSFTFAAWIRLRAKPSNSIMNVASKSLATIDANEWSFKYYNQFGADLLLFNYGPNGESTVTAAGYSPPLNAWIYAICWYDKVAGTVNLQVNNGTVHSQPLGGPVAADTGSPFNLGSSGDTVLNWNGQIDEALFAKRVYDATERAQLWNNGFGLPYPLVPFVNGKWMRMGNPQRKLRFNAPVHRVED